MKNSWDIKKIAKQIVSILHKEEVPISMVQSIFEAVKLDAVENTIPYDPNPYNPNIPGFEGTIKRSDDGSVIPKENKPKSHSIANKVMNDFLKKGEGV